MATPEKAAEEVQIRKVLEDRADALRKKDAGRVIAHGTAGFLHFSLAPPLISKTDARGLTDWFATWRGPIGYEMRDIAVTAGEDVAFATGLARLSGTKTDGERAEVWFRITLGLRKIGGAWKI